MLQASQLHHTPAARCRSFRTARPLRSSVVCSASPSVDRPKTVPVPENAGQQTVQAAAAVEAAWRAGMRLQRVELLLPLIGATDLDDWPGGIRQQFKAAQPLVEGILRSLKQVEGLQGPLTPEIWDQGDAVGCWKGQRLAVVLFPTADTLSKLRELCEAPGGPELVFIVNPQWETAGNLMSDFGFGQRKEQAEKFVASFQPTYWLRQLRIYGDEVRVLRSYPADWQIHLTKNRRVTECIAVQSEQPTYQQIEALLKARPDAAVNKTWLQRLQDEWKFNQDSLKM